MMIFGEIWAIRELLSLADMQGEKKNDAAL